MSEAGETLPRTSLGIERGHYIALRVPDASAAAAFAVQNMGLSLVHVDRDGRHYLAAHGHDAYSLIYAPGESAIDHISYLVAGPQALQSAHDALTAASIAPTPVDASDLWHHGPAVRFKAPNGLLLELTTGVNVDVPMHCAIGKPAGAPAPITFDHAIVRSTDVGSMQAFATGVMGLKQSGRIVAPDGVPFLTFLRAHTLFHCFGLAHSDRDGLHHLQFTLKNDRAVFEAFEAMTATGQAEIIWGPIRHGCGQNVTFYFFDQAGNIVEYSAEEELILNDETYVANDWAITDPRATNEWAQELPPAPMR
jgi:catechol 2,3-dioxygenase